ncbi:MAG: sulfotransferase, partial [Proteobacteria bacterium]|nr:sulfotransferase [Pseudomonadota bacterium]
MTGDANKARAALTRAAEAGDAGAWRRLGDLERDSGRTRSSIAAYQNAIAADASAGLSHEALAHLYEATHDLTRAREHAAKALALKPDAHRARLAVVRVMLRENEFADAIAMATPLATSETASLEHRSMAWGLIGDAQDRMGEYESAFNAFTASNELTLQEHAAWLQPTANIFQPRQVQRMADMAARANVSSWRWPQRLDLTSKVFLIGFPRSGTTLLDQVLSSHANIHCLTEEPFLYQSLGAVFSSSAKLDGFEGANNDEISVVRAAYARYVESALTGEAKEVIVDKLPLNTVLLPLIKRVFENPKIIFALRDPRDVILSCYQQRFGMNDSMAQFLRLETAAAYYDLVMNVFQASRERLQLDIHIIRYEDVVSNLEREARRVAAFLGLEFDPAMLDYQATATRRGVGTPSARQVILPLYSRSVGRWRNYKQQLAPVLPTLDRWV